MKLVLCPRCELNYMADTDRYCKVCQREMKSGSTEEDVELCTICNESPCLPGRDVCMFCLKEMKDQPDEEKRDDAEEVDTSNLSGMESMATMDEIIPEVEMEQKMPEGMEDALSLESVREEEEKEQDEEDKEEEEEF